MEGGQSILYYGKYDMQVHRVLRVRTHEIIIGKNKGIISNTENGYAGEHYCI